MLRPVHCGASCAQENVMPFSLSSNPGNSNTIGIASDIGNNLDMIASGIVSNVGNKSDIRNESDVMHSKWCITNGKSDIRNKSDVMQGKWGITNGESDITNGVPHV